MKTLKTVRTLYKTANENEQTLLPDLTEITEGYTWWNAIYNDGTYNDIDILFARMYMSFIFYSPFKDLIDDYDDSMALSDFKTAVTSLFFKNRKKYEELYNIETIPDDEAYALTNNYDMHETYSGSTTGAMSTISGQRTDVTYDNIGEQNGTNLNKVTGYNSSSENTNDSSNTTTGTREDTHQFTKGQEQDTARSQGTDGHTMRRWGNIGVQSVDDMIGKRKNTWLPWSFLQIIFDDICSELLMIGDDCLWHW